MDQQALAGFFKYGYINAPQSIYQDIFKLLPSTYLKLTRENVRSRENFSPYLSATDFSPKAFWSLLEVANTGIQNQFGDEQEAADELDSLLHKTVSMQMVADVNIGTFLSGGIDSSLISAITQAETGNKVKTFTIGFNEAEYDESRYAERIADYLGTEHKTVYVSARDALEMVLP